MEIYGGLDFSVRGMQFNMGCLGMLLSKRMLTSRADAENDKTLGWLSGLIANDASKHPPWEAQLRKDLPRGGRLHLRAPEFSGELQRAEEPGRHR